MPRAFWRRAGTRPMRSPRPARCPRSGSGAAFSPMPASAHSWGRSRTHEHEHDAPRATSCTPSAAGGTGADGVCALSRARRPRACRSACAKCTTARPLHSLRRLRLQGHRRAELKARGILGRNLPRRSTHPARRPLSRADPRRRRGAAHRLCALALGPREPDCGDTGRNPIPGRARHRSTAASARKALRFLPRLKHTPTGPRVPLHYRGPHRTRTEPPRRGSAHLSQ